MATSEDITDQELLAVANFYTGGCLCGHFESCEICSRSEKQRTFEQNAKRAAVELLQYRGWVVSDEYQGYRRVYSIKEPQ